MDDICPKCGTPKRDEESCPRCGVVFAKFDPAALELDVPEAIRALWLHVEAGWEDRARHALFTEKALAAGAAAYAASKYRERGAGDPIAAEQLARLSSRLEQALAMSSVGARRRDVSSRGKPALYILAIILFLLVGALCLTLMLR
jgi:hypothetical protein